MDKSSKIVYFIPGVTISGGIAVILQHANRLISRGYNVIIINYGINGVVDWFDSIAEIIHWDVNFPCPIQNIDIAIATQYSSVKYVKKIEAKRKIYFVQSDERRFNLSLKEFIECEESYKVPDFEYMTEAIWIQRWLKEEFGYNAYYVPNGLDEKLFSKIEVKRNYPIKTRVLLEGSIDVVSKGMQEAYDSVKDLNIDLWIVSNCGIPKKDWKYEKFFANVPMQRMHEIYSACDIFLKMSKIEGFFGPPLEAMSCGCAVVVGKCTGFDEYIVDNENALVVGAGDTIAAKNAVMQLIENKEVRMKLITNGYETVKKWSWNRSIDFLERVITNQKKEIHYEKDFPTRYAYEKVTKNIMLTYLHNKDNNIENSEMAEKLNAQQRTIDWMQRSKFWKMRNIYVKFKNLAKKFFAKDKKEYL